jgi:hypothetical protein
VEDETYYYSYQVPHFSLSGSSGSIYCYFGGDQAAPPLDSPSHPPSPPPPSPNSTATRPSFPSSFPFPATVGGHVGLSPNGDGGSSLFPMRRRHDASWVWLCGAVGYRGEGGAPRCRRGCLPLGGAAPTAVESSSGILMVFEPSSHVGLASQRHGGAPSAAVKSSVLARHILSHAGLHILDFG